jgi:hypothetical protein
VRESLLAGLGIGLRPTWDIGPDLKSGALQVVMPQYRGSQNVAIYAVYPSRDFMPAKVNVFIEFLAEKYGADPYWDRALDLPSITGMATPPKSGREKASKTLAADVAREQRSSAAR